MMTKSLLPPVDPAAAEIEPSPLPGGFAAGPAQGGDDFFSIISQTLNALSLPPVAQNASDAESSVPPENSPPNISLFSSPPNVDSTSESDAADSSQSPASGISREPEGDARTLLTMTLILRWHPPRLFARLSPPHPLIQFQHRQRQKEIHLPQPDKTRRPSSPPRRQSIRPF